jgi:8-oxo-dGTP pyrophosphatase MutT (NUDIX family)
VNEEASLADVPGLRLPDRLAERARQIQEGRAEAAMPRDASTVILLRDAPAGDGLLVYLLHRVSSMKFAPGAHVFPGGSVDPRDADLSVAWSGPSPAEWGTAFGAGEALARALVCAAVRETFEESGVLLAGPSDDVIVPDTTGDEWETDRQALLDRSLSLAELLGRRGLVLRGDLLRPWAHWITPVIEKRRYDTRFFVAALPAGQRTRDVSSEADGVAWVRPGDAVAAARRGEMALLPPTFMTLAELAPYDSVEAVLAARPDVRPRLPETRVTDHGVFLILPDGFGGSPLGDHA